MPRGFDLGEMKRDLAERDAIDARVVKLTRLLEHGATCRWRWAAT